MFNDRRVSCERELAEALSDLTKYLIASDQPCYVKNIADVVMVHQHYSQWINIFTIGDCGDLRSYTDVVRAELLAALVPVIGGKHRYTIHFDGCRYGVGNDEDMGILIALKYGAIMED